MCDTRGKITFARALRDMEIDIVSDMMYDAGVLSEFASFYSESENDDFWENIEEFCRKHPDKFDITPPCEGYAQYVSLKRDE